MKASVSLITYNHAPYIAQAVEGVLRQQTDFDFELVIGEDDSSDGTREIVKEYQAKHPARIRLFLNDRKNVAYVNGKPTGQWNFLNNLRQCRGQYIALLDGDDYWTSPHKLQKQVDFLETHPDCALCFHNVTVRDERDAGRSQLFHSEPMRERYELADLLRGNFMQTCSVVFRAGLFGELPSWILKCPMGDWPLHVLNARHGWIGYLNEVMAVYRMHGGGIWSAQPRLRILSDSLQAAEQIRQCLTGPQQRRLDAGLEGWHREIIKIHGSEGNAQAASQAAREYFKKFRFRARPIKVMRYLLRALAKAPGEKRGITKSERD